MTHSILIILKWLVHFKFTCFLASSHNPGSTHAYQRTYSKNRQLLVHQCTSLHITLCDFLFMCFLHRSVYKDMLAQSLLSLLALITLSKSKN